MLTLAVVIVIIGHWITPEFDHSPPARLGQIEVDGVVAEVTTA